jgi:hypothetical protein
MKNIDFTNSTGVTVETFNLNVSKNNFHPESVIQVEDAYETYYMLMDICGKEIRVELVQCFPKWANIYKDDVEALKLLVR